MPIVFACPHCGETYRLKDDLAGKKATCKRPTCRKVITVPAASQPIPAGSIAPVDTEALALSALADDAQTKADNATIPVTCKNCDHIWDVPSEKQGKNVTCPECRTINKVPIPKETSRQDWRVGNTGIPSGAKENFQKLEGVQAAGQGGYVSGKAIVDAGAAPKIEYEPLTFGQRFTRYGIPLLLLIGLGGGYWFWNKSRSAGKLEKILNDSVTEVAESEGASPEYQAVARMAKGEFLIRAAKSDPQIEKGVTELATSRNKIQELEKPADKGMLMAELADIQTGLGGEKPQVDAGLKRNWNDAQREVRQTLQNQEGLDKDYRFYLINTLSPKWIAADQGRKLADLARDVSAASDGADPAAFAGLLLLKAKKTEAATELATTIDGEQPSPLELALKFTVNPMETKLPPLPAVGAIRDDLRIAYSTAWALAGKTEESRKLLSRAGGVEARLRAAVLTASLLDGVDAAPFIDAAQKIVVQETKGQGVSPWLVYMLAEQLVRGGKADQAAAVVALLPEGPSRDWGKFAVLRAKGTADKSLKLEDSAADDIAKADAKRVAASYARYWIARRAADPSLLKDPDAKAFSKMGYVLGAQDRTIK